MLNQLTIKNFGLIDQLTLEFNAHLNILTGETGAGKSILIDALRSALGERIDTSSIRDPKLPLFIEAVFDISNKQLLKNDIIAEFLSEEDSSLIIQRTHTSDGKSKIKINGQTVTVGQLKTLGNHLIDFHGPHDHQMLLMEDQHLSLLDQLIDFKNIKDDYKKAYENYSHIAHELQKLAALSQTQARDLDFLTHQVKELESVPLSEEKYEQLLQEQTKINNAEKLHEHIQNILSVLNDDDIGVNNNLRKGFSSMRALVQIDERSQAFLDELTLIQEQSTELSAQLENYAESLEYDHDQAQKIVDQCDIYYEIKRKYGPTLDDAQKLYEASKEKLDLIKNFEHNDKSLRDSLDKAHKEIKAIATKITKSRHKAGTELKAIIESELKELGINHVQFEVRLEAIDFSASGQDRVIFYISPNAGEDLKPLAQIVSSGEAARVMLALKKALIDVDPIPVLIFDEIDAQIGGRLGTITGKKLKSLSNKRQVILITHLPQIASFGNKHFKVSKGVKNNRAITNVMELDAKQRVEELAQMLDGQHSNKTTFLHAQEMLTTGQKKA
jgi:DNA repair protein RecN (Recombination protein N)